MVKLWCFDQIFDEHWHHVALSYNATHYVSYVDGYPYTECFLPSGHLPHLPTPSATIHIGLYDTVLGGGNTGAFGGSM